MKITVVIPTYNRAEQLSDVIDYLLKSESSGFDDIQIIVVDDGSATSSRSVVEEKKTIRPFRLKYIYQNNAGPAEARNNGLRNASNELVVFVDDDVLLFPDALRKHVEAHSEFPRSQQRHMISNVVTTEDSNCTIPVTCNFVVFRSRMELAQLVLGLGQREAAMQVDLLGLARHVVGGDVRIHLRLDPCG